MSVQGITSLKSIILVAASLGSIGGEVLSDGKVDLKDLALLPKLFSVFPSLLAVQWDMAIPEAKDLDLAEANELVEYFKTSFDIPQDDLEVKIENVLSVCVKVSSLISELVAIFKKPAV